MLFQRDHPTSDVGRELWRALKVAILVQNLACDSVERHSIARRFSNYLANVFTISRAMRHRWIHLRGDFSHNLPLVFDELHPVVSKYSKGLPTWPRDSRS